MGGCGGKKRRKREREGELRVQAITSPPEKQAYTQSPEGLRPPLPPQRELEDERGEYVDHSRRMPVKIRREKP
jgi:hypothetical protein